MLDTQIDRECTQVLKFKGILSIKLLLFIFNQYLNFFVLYILEEKKKKYFKNREKIICTKYRLNKIGIGIRGIVS